MDANTFEWQLRGEYLHFKYCGLPCLRVQIIQGECGSYSAGQRMMNPCVNSDLCSGEGIQADQCKSVALIWIITLERMQLHNKLHNNENKFQVFTLNKYKHLQIEQVDISLVRFLEIRRDI